MSAEQAAAALDAQTEYQKIRAINWSLLKYIAVSPLMYKWRVEHPEPRKPAFVFGGAAHCLILEPEKFDGRYAVFDGMRRGKEWDTWQAIHPGVESLKPHEIKRVNAVAEAVLDDRVAAPLLLGGRREEVLTWTDAATGLACKGRLDYIRPDFVTDLKTTINPAPPLFERAASNYGYLAQTAFYHDGAVAEHRIDGNERPYIIAAQSKEPYDVVTFQLKPEALEYGRAFYRSLLQRLLQCTEANYWPGVAPELQALGISPYAADPFAIESGEDF